MRRPGSVPEPDAVIEAMTASLRPRGPDQQSHWSESNVYLGHTRLAIIDRQGGAQPMIGADSGCVLVFNGEIYNFAELRGELERLGQYFGDEFPSDVLEFDCSKTFVKRRQ